MYNLKNNILKYLFVDFIKGLKRVDLGMKLDKCQTYLIY